jgi:hypothetical protein
MLNLVAIIVAEALLYKDQTRKSKEIQDEQAAVEALDGVYCPQTHRYPRSPLWGLWWGHSPTVVSLHWT